MSIAMAVLLAVAGCGGDQAGEGAAGTSPDTTVPTDASGASAPSPTDSSSTTGTSPTTGSNANARNSGSSGVTDGAAGEPVTIAFAGDINFTDAAASNLAADPSTAFGPVATILSNADLTVANLETAVVTSDSGVRASKEFAFQAPASAFDALAAAGIDVASMANNHGMDFGQPGLEQSLAAATEKGFPIVGIGMNETEAFKPFVTEVKGQKIGIIGATQVLDSSLVESWTATAAQPGLASAKRVDTLVAAVERLRPQVDYLVVFLHWGTEKETCPNSAQQELAPVLAAAGADAVIGGHAHRLQSAGYLNDTFVAYGLGNFLFKATSDGAKRSGVLVLTVQSGRTKAYQWLPARIDGENRPIPLSGQEAEDQLALWNDQRDCTGLSASEP
jgi:poly-gamma-glutamate synthesis protein (capsule biosynthesis protein)